MAICFSCVKRNVLIAFSGKTSCFEDEILMQRMPFTYPEDGAQYHPAVRDYEIPTQKKLISR